MRVFPKIGVFTRQIIHFNKVFHYFHHPFWGFSPIFGNTHEAKRTWQFGERDFFGMVLLKVVLGDLLTIGVLKWSQIESPGS